MEKAFKTLIGFLDVTKREHFLRRLPSISGIARRKLTAKLIYDLTSLQPAKYDVLDIGSGIENWSSSVDADMLSDYHTIELKEDLPATFHGDFFTTQFEKKYNFLIATEFLEHVPDPKAFLAQAETLLKNDGYLILSFPFIFKIHGDPDDYFRFTLSGIQSLANGLFDVEISYAHGGKFQVLWETLIDGKVFYPLRIFNSLIANTRPTKSAFPLGYVVALRKL